MVSSIGQEGMQRSGPVVRDLLQTEYYILIGLYLFFQLIQDKRKAIFRIQVFWIQGRILGCCSKLRSDKNARMSISVRLVSIEYSVLDKTW